MITLTKEQKQDLLSRFKKKSSKSSFPSTITPLTNKGPEPYNMIVDRNEESISSSVSTGELKTSYNSSDYKKTELPVRDSDLDRCLDPTQFPNGNVERLTPSGYVLPWLPFLQKRKI